MLMIQSRRKKEAIASLIAEEAILFKGMVFHLKVGRLARR